MKRTTIFLGQSDHDAIRAVQERYGVSTASDAIRLALRVLAESQALDIRTAVTSVRVDDEKEQAT